jgi:hypothetical protein
MQKKRPILFNEMMVLALLNKTKTQTRRALTPKHIRSIDMGAQLGECHPLHHLTPSDQGYVTSFCPFGQVGDYLYVRETFQFVGDPASYPCPSKNIVYRAGYPDNVHPSFENVPSKADMRFRTSLHMPKWAARIQLKIESVRLEQLTAICEADAIAEGIDSALNENGQPRYRDYETGKMTCENPIDSFRTLWCSTGGKWDESVYVWVLGFKVLSTSNEVLNPLQIELNAV